MKLLFSHFAAPALLAASTLLAGCSSDNPPASNTGGTNSGGSASGGKPGTGGSVSVGGGGAGGSAGSTVSGGSAGLGAAGSGTAGGAAVEASFAMVKDLITTSCFGGNGCHGQEGNPMELKLDDSLYTTLTTHTTKNCGKVVNLTSPAESALVKLMQGSCGTPPNVTDRMPFGGSCVDGDTDPDSTVCVPPAKIAAVQAWIAKGAPKQ